MCCLTLWSFWLVTFVSSFQQLANLLLPVSCLFLFLAHLTTFLYTFAPAHLSIVEFRSQCTSLSPCGQHLQPFVFPIWKGHALISHFPKQGQFLPPNKIQVPALKIPFPFQVSLDALTPIATIIMLWDMCCYYYYYPILQLINPRLKEISYCLRSHRDLISYPQLQGSTSIFLKRQMVSVATLHSWHL